MAERKSAPSPRAADDQRTAEAQAAHERAAAPVSDPKLKTADGGKGAGPKSALKGGLGSDGDAAAGPANEHGFQAWPDSKSVRYSVQAHTDEKGMFVEEPVEAESGDEAANKVLAKHGYKGVSIRGIDVYSAPDPNSLGGEREAVNMIRNAQNGGNIINTLGTEANAEATRKLGEADIKELGE